MLGFVQICEERMCPRVKTSAVLLRLSMAYASAQIEKYGGLFSKISGVRSLYPYFMGVKDENGITERLTRGD